MYNIVKENGEVLIKYECLAKTIIMAQFSSVLSGSETVVQDADTGEIICVFNYGVIEFVCREIDPVDITKIVISSHKDAIEVLSEVIK